MPHSRGRVFALVLLACLLFAYLPSAVLASNVTLGWCPQFARIGYVLLKTAEGDTLYTLSDTQLAALAAWKPTFNTWTPSGNYGVWNMPADAQETYLLDVRTEANAEHFIFLFTSPSDLGHVWVFAYTDLSQWADSHGAHEGVHNWGCGNVGSHFRMNFADALPLLPVPVPVCTPAPAGA